ncbi:MAG: hypothetical protein ABIG20_02060 [archaeon]
MYYIPYGYWGVEHMLFYDIPLFLLCFGLIVIVMKFVVRLQDPVMNTAIAAFAASLAYFIIKSEQVLYKFFYDSWSAMLGIFVMLIILLMLWFMIKL